MTREGDGAPQNELSLLPSALVGILNMIGLGSSPGAANRPPRAARARLHALWPARAPAVAEVAFSLPGCVAGVALCLHYGRIGFMPLDQSIVFDGAWRLLCGQVPFRDFATPAGLVPIAMQAAFFHALGVSWFAYCLHAALLNGLFCLLVYVLLRLLEAPPPVAGYYGLLSGVVFYTPFGVPYMEQHAFFFSLLFVVLLTAVIRCPPGRARDAALALLPVAALLAFLSKQIPTVFVLPLAAALPAALARGERRRALSVMAASGLALTIVLVAALLLLHVDADAVRDSLLGLPGEEGNTRLVALTDPATLRLCLGETLRALRLPSLAAAAALGLWALRRGQASWRLGLALHLVLVCGAFTLLTDNQSENGVPYVFVAIGLVQASWPALGSRGWRHLAGAGLALLAGVDAVRFNARVNVTRMVHELEGVPAAPANEQKLLPPALGFLEWRLHPFYHYRPADFAGLLTFLGQHPAPFVVIGDTSVLNGLAGRRSVSPVLWLHPGLTLPRPGTAAFADFESRLLARIRSSGVRFVVRESRQTYNGLRLSHLPRLAALIEERGHVRRSFGPIDVFDLGQ